MNPNYSQEMIAQQRPLDDLHIPPSYLNRRIQGPKRLQIKVTGEDYRKLSKTLDEQGALDPNDADKTKINIAGIQKKWDKYCEFIDEPDSHAALLRCSKGTCMAFLKFILDTYRVPKYSSIQQYWRQFKMLFSRCNGYRMNTNSSSEVTKYLAGPLKTKYNLDKSIKAKPVMGVDDLLRVLVYHWAKDTAILPNERQRVQLATILLFAAYTSSRPAELVDAEASGKGKDKNKKWNWDWSSPAPWEDCNDSNYDDDNQGAGVQKSRGKAICYEDIRLMVLRNPDDQGRPVVAMEVKLQHPKGVDRKPKPTSYLFRPENDPIFCPVIHLLALAFDDNAFEAESLSSAEQVFGFKIDGPGDSFQLKWKPNWLKKPIFRQAVRTGSQFSTSLYKALSYSTFNYYIQRLGCATGFEEKFSLYCIRRGTGNAVDGVATTAVRDQVMRHDSGSKVFQTYYLNSRAGCDVQAAFLERPSANGLLKAFAHMGLTCDPQAPVSMPEDIFDALPLAPEIVTLQHWRGRLMKKIRAKSTIAQARKNGAHLVKEYDKVLAAINAAKTKRRKDADKDYRKEYFDQRHTKEVERQLNGIEGQKYIEPIIQHQLEERTQLQHVLCDTRKDLSEQSMLQRRLKAVDLMTALCRRREMQRHRSRATRPRNVINVEEVPQIDPFPLVCQKTQCPICIGDESMTYLHRTFSYCRPSKLMDHVESHLRAEPDNFSCRHPVCKANGIVLKNMDHFRNHVQAVHGITLRFS